MVKSRTFRVSFPMVVGATLAAAALAPVASAATQRYAAPSGSGTDCSSANPCDIRQAVEHAQTGDEVIVSPGDYPLPAVLTGPAPITIHGIPGKPRPRLLFSSGNGGLQLNGSTLRYVDIEQSSGGWALDLGPGSTMDQTTVKSVMQAVAARNSLVRNSIVVVSGGGGARGIYVSAYGASNPVTLRNVTAIARGTSGVAILAQAGSGVSGKASILAKNVIARGGSSGAALKATTDNSNASAKITVGSSNWLGWSVVGTNAQIEDAGGNQSSAPAFIDAAAGDYRQAAGSPTINAGLPEAIDGDFDIDGDPRQIGAIDIGADEFVVAPVAITGLAGAVTDRSATLTGTANANGAPTSYHFEYGPTTAYGSSTPNAGAGKGGAVPAAATLGGLSPATTYHYRIVAANSGGAAKGADRTFTTAAAPPIPPATTPGSPSSGVFAGVRLASARLSFDGRFVRLKLSCPAGTVGGCSGRTKLTARRRTRSGATTSVTLGRASFRVAAGAQARVRVRVSRAGRLRLSGLRRLRAKDTNAARDGAGRSKTTANAVTIRRVHRTR